MCSGALSIICDVQCLSSVVNDQRPHIMSSLKNPLLFFESSSIVYCLLSVHACTRACLNMCDYTILTMQAGQMVSIPPFSLTSATAKSLSSSSLVTSNPAPTDPAVSYDGTMVWKIMHWKEVSLLSRYLHLARNLPKCVLWEMGKIYKNMLTSKTGKGSTHLCMVFFFFQIVLLLSFIDSFLH